MCYDSPKFEFMTKSYDMCKGQIQQLNHALHSKAMAQWIERLFKCRGLRVDRRIPPPQIYF